MRDILIGTTDYTVLVKIAGTDGAPETGLTEASIDLAYSRVETDNDVTCTDVTPAALSALTDAHTDWGFEEVDSTNAPGLYRLDIADAVFASGAWEAVVTITDASGTDFYAVDIGFRLVAFNSLDAVRLGLTALPNANAEAAGGLYTRGTGAGQLSQTTNGELGVVTLTDTVTDLTNLPAITSNWLTAAGLAADAGVEIAAAVWDRVLSGANHNIANSAGRRLRALQDFGLYEGGAIWIDTVNGTAGTTAFENGTVENPVDTLADALTIAAAIGLKHLHLVNGSTITLAGSLANYEVTGDEYGIALGGQSVDGASIHNAHKVGVGVSGTFTGNPHILHSMIDTAGITGPNARIGWCAIMGAVTSNSTGTWVLHSCWGLSGAQFDFGAGGAQTVYITDWVGGPITIANMATGDVLYFEGRSAVLTLAASCTGGTVYLAGDIALTNSGSGQTINQTSRYEITRILSDGTAFAGANIAAILARLGAFTGTGVNTVLGFLKAMFSKTATLPSDVGGTADPAADSLEAIRDRGDAAWVTGDGGGGAAGSGADECTITVSVSGSPLPDADVWVSSDSAGATVVAGTLQTDSSGEVMFLLDAGSVYYLWAQKDGTNSIKGSRFVAVAD